MPPVSYSVVDHFLAHVDQAVRTVFGQPPTTARPNPAGAVAEAPLSPADQQAAARLMRVNHTGEVCAQALYQGQALTARQDAVRARLQDAAAEENDHLDWCKSRLDELGNRPSVLNPLFYAGSFVIGALNGKLGDRWNLGFLAATEQQVVEHLESHLRRLPTEDAKSRAILEQMKVDENEHATTALAAGGVDLPAPIRLLMRAASQVMTRATYWV